MKQAPPEGALIRKSVRFDVKTLDDQPGVFEGYASTFDVDSMGDVIMPGAFKRTLAAHVAKGRPIPILWQHKMDEPIGVTLDAREDARGLFVRGKLILDVERAKEAHALMRENALGGLSIGFSIPKDGAEWDEETGLRRIKELRLYEYSPVTFPANENAVLTGVKSAHETALLAEFAELRADLRELITVLRGSPAEPSGTERAPDLSGVLKEAREILAAYRGS